MRVREAERQSILDRGIAADRRTTGSVRTTLSTAACAVPIREDPLDAKDTRQEPVATEDRDHCRERVDERRCPYRNPPVGGCY
jgi:hypothetical protein